MVVDDGAGDLVSERRAPARLGHAGGHIAICVADPIATAVLVLIDPTPIELTDHIEAAGADRGGAALEEAVAVGRVARAVADGGVLAGPQNGVGIENLERGDAADGTEP